MREARNIARTLRPLARAQFDATVLPARPKRDSVIAEASKEHASVTAQAWAENKERVKAAKANPCAKCRAEEMETAAEAFKTAKLAAQAILDAKVKKAWRQYASIRGNARHNARAGRQAVWKRFLSHGNAEQLINELRELTRP
jgi:hypothetical protein